MRGGQDDRRVKYTKMVLKESFIKLLERKDILQITIKEICEDADINRTTFYAHYTDQFDLMKKIEQELLGNIQTYLAEYRQKSDMNPVLLAERIFVYLKENARLCKLLLSERGEFNFQMQVMKLVYDLIIVELTDKNGLTKEDAEYVYSFTITGCVGIVQKWLDEGMKKTPRFMAEMVIKFVLGLIGLLRNNR